MARAKVTRSNARKARKRKSILPPSGAGFKALSGQLAAATKAGWTIEEFCPAAGIGRTLLYSLPASMQPASVKIGRRRVITESPADYMQRIAQMQTPASA